MNTEDQIRDLKNRGAIEIKDGEGSGFHDDDLAPVLDDFPELKKQVDEIEQRQHEAKPESSEFAEKAQQVHEQSEEQVRKFRFDRQGEVTDFVPGKLMHMGEFLQKLKQINATFEYNEFSAMGLRGISYLDGGPLGLRTYITSVQDGVSPEWSQLRVDEHGIGTSEKFRGWRTVLMNLISAGIVTEDQVHQVFGKPTGPRAARWFRNLYMLRNGVCRECGQQLCVCRQVGEGARADNYARES